MDSLDAVLRWNAKRDAVFQKIEKQNARKVMMPERAKVKIRTRPGEVTREEFGAWMGALAPEAGAVNEFRTKMYQSDLRGLQNRIKVNQPDERTQRILQFVTFPADPPKNPGIQLFFQNSIDNSPLPGLRGGALTQLPPTAREYRRVEETVRKNLRSQMRDLTAMRASQPFPPAQREVLTALDEAKLQIGTTVETIAQQLLRGIYTTDVLRELTTVSASIARNAPLMDAGALGELYRYVADLVSAMRAGAKNTGKEIADENLIAFDDDAAEFYDIYGLPAAPAAQPRDLDIGVKASQNVAEAIYARVEALFEFLKRQYAVAERPMAERIQSARASLPALGTNIDRKSYPADVRKRLNLEEQQRAAATAQTETGDVLGLEQPAPAGMPTLDVGELEQLAPALPPAMLEPSAAGPDMFEANISTDELLTAADEANREGRFDDEVRLVREGYRTLIAFGRREDATRVAELAAERGIEIEPAQTAASTTALVRYQPPSTAAASPILREIRRIDKAVTDTEGSFATAQPTPLLMDQAASAGVPFLAIEDIQQERPSEDLTTLSPDVYESSITVGEMIENADAAREEGRRADYWRLLREAFLILRAFSRNPQADALQAMAASNGVDVTRDVPADLVAAQAAAAEEEAPAAEEERAPAASAAAAAPAAAPAAARAAANTIEIDQAAVRTILEEYAREAGVPVASLSRETKIGRDSPLLVQLNALIKKSGKRFNSGAGSITLSKVNTKLREANVFVVDEDTGEAKLIDIF